MEDKEEEDIEGDANVPKLTAEELEILRDWVYSRSIKQVYYEIYKLDQMPSQSKIALINTILGILNAPWFRLLRNFVNVIVSSRNLYLGLKDVNFYYFFVGGDLGKLVVSVALILDYYYGVLGLIYAVP